MPEDLRGFPEASASAPLSGSAPSTTPSGGTAPLRVLVVDDELSLRQMYRTMLTEHGFYVRAAANGRQALQFLMQETFDVLLVDLRMEGMDGIAFLQEALKIWPWIGVIIVSAYLTEDAHRRAQEMGVSRLLQKPVPLPTLVAQIQDEVRAKRRPELPSPHVQALALMRDHLGILSQLDTQALGAGSLEDALREFGQSLLRLLPCEAVGILILEERHDPVINFSLKRALPASFLDRVESEMLTRYEAISGRSLPREAVRLQGVPSEASPSDPPQPGCMLSVPLIINEEVCGLVTLAACEKTAYSPEQVSVLYHAANHISAVFLALRRMHRLAARDPLTGLYNRLRLEEEIERAWQASRRYGTPMAVAVIDLDNFKTLNDAYGHSVGDQVLVEFAELLRGSVRGTDIVARYGGDEFVAILSHATDKEAQAFAERLIELTRARVFCERQYRLKLTVSVGAASSLNATLPSTSGVLLSQADRALFMAKRAGRNRLCIWPGEALEPKATGPTVSRAEPAGGKRPPQARILVVDDDPHVVDLIGAFLRGEAYEIVAVGTVQEALGRLREEPGRFDLMLADLRLPDGNGLELIRQAGRQDPSLVKIVISGQATIQDAIASLREGVYDMVTKPFDRQPFLALIRRAAEYRRVTMENIRYQAHLEEMCAERSAQLAHSLEELRRAYEFTLQALVAMLDAREHGTGRHSLRARDLAVTVGRYLGLSGTDLESLATAALLHDIGKIAVRDDILLKPGPLLPEEWVLMKQHPTIGYEILRPSPHLRGAAEIVLQHHERYDGTGYPAGLKGEQICLGARIFAATDAYDAMRSERCYRRPLGPKEALAEIVRHSGTQFDPKVVEALVACQPELERILSEPLEPASCSPSPRMSSGSVSPRPAGQTSG